MKKPRPDGGVLGSAGCDKSRASILRPREGDFFRQRDSARIRDHCWMMRERARLVNATAPARIDRRCNASRDDNRAKQPAVVWPGTRVVAAGLRTSSRARFLLANEGLGSAMKDLAKKLSNARHATYAQKKAGSKGARLKVLAT